MFKRREAKPPKKKRLWEKDFNLVEDGLEEKQVVSFVWPAPSSCTTL